MFSCKFCKAFKNICLAEHLQMILFYVYSWILRSFLQNLFYRTHLGDCLFHVQAAGFQPAYPVSILQVLFVHFVKEREVSVGRCSFNVNLWKISLKTFFLSEVASTLFIYFSFFAFIFSGRITITSSEEALKLYEHSFLFGNINENSSATCVLPVQLQFI